MMPDFDQELDLLGLKCPLPVLRTRKALRALEAGQRLKVLTNDPISGIDIPNLVREEGHTLESSHSQNGHYQFTICKRD
jgi:tRNA 2-thiouridine synthesizing protein A